AIFFDAGVNRILLPSELKMNASRVADLNAKYPQAGFDGRVRLAPGTQNLRSSVGLELQVLLPVVQAPFRVYWAYNPNLVREYLQPPIVADRAMFPNNATFLNAITQFGQAYPFFEKHSTFRFTIGRTFCSGLSGLILIERKFLGRGSPVPIFLRSFVVKSRQFVLPALGLAMAISASA